MTYTTLSVVIAALVVNLLLCHVAPAEEHSSAALEEADKAAHSAGDAVSIREHAAAALRHVEAAKAAHASETDVVKHLQEGEAHLNAAEINARYFHSTTATEEAGNAKTHFEAAKDAAQTGAHPEAAHP